MEFYLELNVPEVNGGSRILSNRLYYAITRNHRQLWVTTICIHCSHWLISHCYSSNLLGIVSKGS